MSKNKLQQKDTSKSQDIQEVAEMYKDSSMTIRLDRAERDNLILIEQLRDLKEEIAEKDAIIKHMQDRMNEPQNGSYQPNLGTIISDEEAIALKQLEILKRDSTLRPLSLEEIKIYDILVKNKRLAQGSSTQVIDTVKLPKEKVKLIEIASKKINEPVEE